MTLTVIVPCFNEEEVIAETHARLTRVLSSLENIDTQLIYVDDGSRDRTPSILRWLCSRHPSTHMIRLSRNFGHQIALSAGLDHASGDAVVFIDADLQDPPEVISSMVEAWRAGFDVVYGLRTERLGEGYFKRVAARVFYRILNALSDIPIPLDTGDFRLVDRRVVNAILSMPERHRFLRGMVSWAGFKQTYVPYTRQPRAKGTSKYPLWKMLQLASDGIVSFSTKPLRFATWMGFIASAIAVLGALYALILRLLTNVWVTGWTALFISVLFMGGVQLISLGVIGEYLAKTYDEVKRRPLYLVEDSIGFERHISMPIARQAPE